MLRRTSLSAIAAALALFTLWPESADAAIGLRSQQTATANNTTSVTVSRPAGAAVGDVLVAHVGLSGVPALVNAPAGWNLIEDDSAGIVQRQLTYYRIVTASEPASYTWNWVGGLRAAAAVSAFTGVKTSNPIDASSGASGSGDTATAPSVSTSRGGVMLILAASYSRVTSFSFAAGTEIYDFSAGAGNNGETAAASTRILASGGATGDQTATASNSNQSWAAQLIALRPEGTTLTAQFPSDYGWGQWSLGANLSDEQLVTISSDDDWGLRVSSDIASGRMREWDGSSYGTAQLGAALDWKLSSIDGVAQPGGYQSFSSTPATVLSGQPPGSDVEVGVTYRQQVDYGDEAGLPPGSSYRMLVTYDAAQGF